MRKRILSRPYQIYKEEEKLSTLPRTIYEKATRFAYHLLKLEPDEQTEKMLKDAIEFSHLRVKPGGVASLTILFTLIVCIPSAILMVTNVLGLPGFAIGTGVLIIALSIPVAIFLYIYPLYQKKLYQMRAGSSIINMVLYMAIFMRNMPNMEGAVDFAAKNLTGPLAFELRKLMWDVQIGRYTTIYEALSEFTGKWKENREFMESVDVLTASLDQPERRRMDMLGEAISIILEGSRENSRHYTQQLRMPIVIINALGIILPVMGLVLFPIVAVFLGIESFVLFAGYDIVLPLVLFFVIYQVLQKRPATFSQINVEENPDLPPQGKYPIKLNGKTKYIPILPFGFIPSLLLILVGTQISDEIFSAIVIIAGIAIGPAIYYLLNAMPRMDLRQRVRSIELEFTEALFQLGNRVSSGIPMETALQGVQARLSNLKIKAMFKRALENMQRMGMTFESAFFHTKYGAVRFYPSDLINTVMRIVVESGKKGVATASEAMLAISRYLKGLHRTQEEVNEQMGEVLDTLKFQAFFLSPMIAGVIGTLAIIIMNVLSLVTEKMTALGGVGGLGFFMSMSELNITPFQFLMIVGIYMIESAFILAFFINGIQNGEDKIGFHFLAGTILIASIIVFSISLFITLSIFTPMIMSVVI
jgi:hypothetical protein